MSAIEDETQSLDAGWDDAPSEPRSSAPGEAEIDDAWDSLPPPVSAARSSAAPSVPPLTEEVDGGWDDVPDPAPGAAPGKRRPHRPRRVSSGVVEVGTSALVMPRPAEPTKKHQRELARKQRAHAAQVREKRKAEEKAQRAAVAREQAAARLRRTEAEAQARREREEARERARAEKRVAKPKARAARVAPQTRPGGENVEGTAPRAEVKSAPTPRSKLRPGVIVTLVLLALVLLLVLRK